MSHHESRERRNHRHQAPPSSEPAARAAQTAERATHSPGEALDPQVRDAMEARFGQDFGDVRVHADAEAAQIAGDVGAAAFAIGDDLVFDRGAYAPDTGLGEHILAHELAHVVQQRRPAAARLDDSGPIETTQPGDAAERDAAAAASTVSSGASASVTHTAPASIARGLWDDLVDGYKKQNDIKNEPNQSAWDTYNQWNNALTGRTQNAKAIDSLENLMSTGNKNAETSANAWIDKNTDEGSWLRSLGHGVTTVDRGLGDLTTGAVAGGLSVLTGLGDVVAHPIDAGINAATFVGENIYGGARAMGDLAGNLGSMASGTQTLEGTGKDLWADAQKTGIGGMIAPFVSEFSDKKDEKGQVVREGSVARGIGRILGTVGVAAATGGAGEAGAAGELGATGEIGAEGGALKAPAPEPALGAPPEPAPAPAPAPVADPAPVAPKNPVQQMTAVNPADVTPGAAPPPGFQAGPVGSFDVPPETIPEPPPTVREPAPALKPDQIPSSIPGDGGTPFNEQPGVKPVPKEGPPIPREDPASVPPATTPGMPTPTAPMPSVPVPSAPFPFPEGGINPFGKTMPGIPNTPGPFGPEIPVRVNPDAVPVSPAAESVPTPQNPAVSPAAESVPAPANDSPPATLNEGDLGVKTQPNPVVGPASVPPDTVPNTIPDPVTQPGLGPRTLPGLAPPDVVQGVPAPASAPVSSELPQVPSFPSSEFTGPGSASSAVADPAAASSSQPSGPTTWEPTGSREPGDPPPSTPPGFEGLPRPFPVKQPAPPPPSSSDFGQISEPPAPPPSQVPPTLQTPFAPPGVTPTPQGFPAPSESAPPPSSTGSNVLNPGMLDWLRQLT
jgi:hypothetical protein